MQEKVFAYLRQWNMVKPGDTVLVGFSGGADSTALLQLLWNYGKRIPLQLEAVHVNHGIRGAEALRDQQFCEQFCQERNISFTVVQEDVPAQAARDGLSLEEAGRNARRRVFEHLAEKCQASVIALAHHQRDQAETMLFRLMRGTGLRGLCGMRPVNGNYIRPLLCVDRPQIEQYLLEEGIRWVEDGTNQELDYTRNQIRHGLLAPMEQVMPGCVARMAGTVADSGMTALFAFIALLSLNLGFLNLLPIPLLDGGLLILTLIEGISGKELPERALYYIQAVGITIIGFIFLFAMFNDVMSLMK